MKKLILPVALLLLSSCSQQQWREAGKGWQRNECLQRPSVTEREECLREVESRK